MVFSELEAQMSVNASDFSSGLSSAASDAQSFASNASSSFSVVGNYAEDMGDRVSRSQRGFARLSEALIDTVIPARLLGGRLERVGREASSAGRKAAAASTGFISMAGSISAANFMMGVLGTVTSSTTLTLGVLLGTVGLLVTALAPLAIGAAAVAAAFGVIVGSGIVAWGEGFQKALKSARKEIMPMVKSLGKQFVPLLKDAVNALPGLVKNIINAIGPLDQFKQALRTFGQIAADLLPKLITWFFDLGRNALPMVRKLATFFLKNLLPALRTITKTGKRLISRVRDLVSWFQSTTKQGSKVRKKFNQLKSAAKTFWQNLQPVINALGPLFQQFKKVAPVVASFALDIATLAVNIGTKLLPFVKTLINVITGVLKWFNSLSSTFQKVILTVGGLVASLGPLISLATTVFGTISTVVGVAASLWGTLTTVISVIWTVVSVVGTLVAALNPIVLAIGAVIAAAAALWLAFDGNFGKIESFVTSTLNSVISFIKTWGGKILSWFEGFVSDVVGWFNDMWTKGKKEITHGLGIIMDYMTGDRGPLASIKSAGKALIDEFISGIKSKADDVGQAVGDIAGKARDKLPFSPAKEGPLSDLDKTGPAFVDTFASGIENNRRQVERTVSNTMAVAQPQANAPPASTRRGRQRPTEISVTIQTDDEALKKWVEERANVVVEDTYDKTLRAAERRGRTR